MPEEILHVRSRRAARMKRVQTVQHVLAAILLITSGTSHLHHNTVLAVAEIAAGALLVGTVVLEGVRHLHASRIGWVELAGAIMVFVEAIEKTRGRHHTLFYVLAFVQPLVLLAFAFFDAQIAQTHYLKATDSGVVVRMRIFFWRRYAWKDVDRISLRDVVDQEKARRWLLQQRDKRVSGEAVAT